MKENEVKYKFSKQNNLGGPLIIVLEIWNKISLIIYYKKKKHNPRLQERNEKKGKRNWKQTFWKKLRWSKTNFFLILKVWYKIIYNNVK